MSQKSFRSISEHGASFVVSSSSPPYRQLDTLSKGKARQVIELSSDVEEASPPPKPSRKRKSDVRDDLRGDATRRRNLSPTRQNRPAEASNRLDDEEAYFPNVDMGFDEDEAAFLDAHMLLYERQPSSALPPSSFKRAEPAARLQQQPTSSDSDALKVMLAEYAQQNTAAHTAFSKVEQHTAGAWPKAAEKHLAAADDKKAAYLSTAQEAMAAAHSEIHPPIASSSKSKIEPVELSQMMTEQSPAAEPVIQLSAEQQKLLNLAKSGQSIFFTGSAGTGKSVLLRAIIREMRKLQRDPTTVHVCASTGMAATLLSGCTLHSFSGVGLAKAKQETLVRQLFGDKAAKARNRWKLANVLIIDEISMIDGRFFDKLEYVGRQIRGKLDVPFGGLQIIATGDFFQLPPVPDDIGVSKFAFQATSWSQVFKTVYSLRDVFRQKDDTFVRLLNEMRLGIVTPECVQVFTRLRRKVVYDDGIDPTWLMPVRAQVKEVNESRLKALRTETVEFQASDKAVQPAQESKEPLSVEEARKRLDRDTLADFSISLKIGAQVICIKNMTHIGIVNGSKGIVTDFLTEQQAKKAGIRIAQPDPREADKEEREAMAAMMHAAQYPANDTNAATGEVKPEPIDLGEKWPVVKYEAQAGGGRTRECLMIPVVFEVQNGQGHIEAIRSQTPLILAWALTIHKAQGQTLTRVKIDLGRAFEKGQAYVACSRATSMDTLEISGFAPNKVIAHPEVTKWYKRISQA